MQATTRVHLRKDTGGHTHGEERPPKTPATDGQGLARPESPTSPLDAADGPEEVPGQEAPQASRDPK
jgi:hypothetical protein